MSKKMTPKARKAKRKPLGSTAHEMWLSTQSMPNSNFSGFGRRKVKICGLDIMTVRRRENRLYKSAYISPSSAKRLAAKAGVEVPKTGFDSVLPDCNARLYKSRAGFSVSTVEGSGTNFRGARKRPARRR